MRRRVIFFTLTILLLMAASAGLHIYRENTPGISIQDVIDKAKKLAPSSTIEELEAGEWLVKPEKAISINVDGERIYVYEYKDSETAQKGTMLLTESSLGKGFIVDNKDKIATKYAGKDERVILLFSKLLD